MSSMRQTERRDAGALAVGLAVSAALHVLLLSIGIESAVPPDVYRRTPMPALSAMQSVQLRIVEETRAATGRSTTPDPSIAPARRVPAPVGTVPVPDPTPGMPDARLFDTPRALTTPSPDPWARYEARLDAGITEYYDSLAAAAAAELAPRSWTGQDGEGRRWGAAPGALFLGGRRLRFCGGTHNDLDCGFGASPGRLAELQTRVERFAEIAAQRDLAQYNATLEERVRAVRARALARRDSTRSD